MDIPSDLIELFSAFADAGVLAPDPENIDRACLALARFGVPEAIVRALQNKQAVGRPQDRRDVRLLLGQTRPSRKRR